MVMHGYVMLHVVGVIRVDIFATLGYLDDLLKSAFNLEKETTPDAIPGPMASMYDKPENPEQLKAEYCSRFSLM